MLASGRARASTTYADAVAAATAWAAQVVTNGGTVSSTRQAFVLELIFGLMLDDLWRRFDRLWLLAAENSASALTDLKGLALATAVGGPTFTANQGYAGEDLDAPTKYIDTNATMNALSQFTSDSCHYSYWCNTNLEPLNGGAIFGTNRINSYMTEAANDNAYCRVNDASESVAQGAPATRKGLWFCNRSGVSNTEFYRNAVLFSTPNETSGSLPGRTCYILAANDFGSPLNGNQNQCGMVSIGGSFNSADVAKFYSRILAYMAAVTTQAWVNQVVADGGTVSAARQALVRDLIAGLMLDGVWFKLDRLWMFSAENRKSALRDLVAIAQAQEGGSPDAMLFTVDQGYKGNATSAYIETNFNPSTDGKNYSLNSASAGVWDTSFRAEHSNKGDFGAYDGSFAAVLSVHFSGDLAIGRLNSGSNTSGPYDAPGLYALNRSASNAQTIYRRGSDIGSSGLSAASDGVPNRSMSVGNYGGLTSYSDDQYAAFFVGGSLTATEHNNLHARLGAYLVAIEPDVAAWTAAVSFNGGVASIARQILVYNLITALKAAGIWAKLDRLWLFASESANSALVDLVTRAVATRVNNPTFAVDQGFTGNGSDSYIDTNYTTKTNYTQDSACIFGWNSSTQTIIFGVFQSGVSVSVVEAGFANTGYHLNGPGSAHSPSPAVTTQKGLWLVNRPSSAGYALDVNGAEVAACIDASAPIPTQSMQVLADRTGAFSSGQVAAFGAGAGLTSTERVALYNILRTYMTGVGLS